MKTFFTIIPLQGSKDLKACIYQAVDNSDLQMDTPTCFPIMTAMHAYAKPGEEIRVVAILSAVQNCETNLEKFREEVEKMSQKIGFTYPRGIEVVNAPADAGVRSHIETFQRLIEKVEDNADKAINSASFDHHWGYQGNLGCQVSDTQTSFKLWSPTATTVQVIVYESASNDAPILRTYEMERGNSYSYSHKYNTIGVWSLTVPENLAGRAYQYQIEFPHHQSVTRDPYTTATSPDGKRSAILSEEERQVDG